MSGIKRAMEEIEQQDRVARRIALKSGVLESCKDHGIVFRGNAAIVDAYKLGNANFSVGDEEVCGAFADRTEMTDAIKRVVEHDCAIECYDCERMHDE
jgi:hypothetical protein